MPNKTDKQKLKMIIVSFSLLRSVLLITFISILVSCNTTQPPPGNNAAAELTVEDVSSTEAWLNVKTQNVTLPAELKLLRADSVTRIINLGDTDTLLYDNELQPNKTYNYKVIIQPSNHTAIQSKTVTATTMDTTSHNFSWQTYTFGGANGSSVLNDVAIINENNIWAVGEIHTAETDQFDSNGVWVQPYNAVHWDGNTWALKRIIVNFRGNSTFIPLEGIFAFSSNDIWVVGSLPIHGDGNNWKIYDVREITSSNLSLSKAWGMSSNDIYFVGRGGSIAHYNGSEWRKIESGTELRFFDINGKNEKIYCIAAELFSGINSELYEIVNGRAILNDGTNLGVSSVSVYVLSNKLYVFGYYRLVKTVGKAEWRAISEPVNFDGYSRIRGRGYNDIVVAGSFGKIDHFNGVNWSKQRIKDKENNLVDFSSIAIKGNIVCAVGGVSIVTGRR